MQVIPNDLALRCNWEDAISGVGLCGLTVELVEEEGHLSDEVLEQVRLHQLFSFKFLVDDSVLTLLLILSQSKRVNKIWNACSCLLT